MSRFPEYIYENTPRNVYPLGDGEGDAYFLPVCPHCGRYIKMDDNVYWNEYNGFKDQPNATCSKCGRIKIECEMID
jgi:hypothetical protein